MGDSERERRRPRISKQIRAVAGFYRRSRNGAGAASIQPDMIVGIVQPDPHRARVQATGRRGVG